MLTAYPIAQFNKRAAFYLDHSASVDADHGVQGRAAVYKLVMGLLLIEQGVVDDACFNQEFQCPVDGGLGYAMSLRTHRLHERVGFEDAVLADDRIEDVRPFRGVLEILFLQMPSKYGAQGSHLHRIGRKECAL